MSGKRILFAIAAVAIFAVGYFAVKGYPPVDKGAEGTIGAAQRYQSEQIKTGDVVLKDKELQEVLQSDAYNKLTKDPEARKAITSDAFKAAMANDSFRAALANDSFRAALAKDAFAR